MNPLRIARLITEDPDVFNERDYNEIINSFNNNCSRLGLKIDELGNIDEYPVYLATPKEINHNNPNILIIAGFHGEEPAPVYAVVKFLQDAKDNLLNFVNLSIIPAMNPYGFENNARYGPDNKATNQIYHNGKLDPSDNCKLLLKNENLIKRLSKDCLLDLHENIDVDDEFYIYAYSDDKEDPNVINLTDIARLAAIRHFKQRKDGHYEDSNPGKAVYDVENGLVWNSKDDSFDDYMSSHTTLIVLETPAKNELDARIAAHNDFIKSIVSHLKNDIDDVNILSLPKGNQTTKYSCGGASLRAVLRYYGVDDPEHKINRLAEISREGIDPDKITATAAKYGLKSKIYKNWNTKELKKYLKKRIPVIVGVVAWGNEDKDYTKDDDGHYVVAIGYDKCRIYFEDPSIKGDNNDSKGYMDWKEFLTRWHDVDGKCIGIPVWSESHKNATTQRKSSTQFIRIP